MITCKYCNLKNSDTAHYCANCGKELGYIRYTVIPTYELDSLRNDRRELQRYKTQERNSWFYKIKQLWKKSIEDGFWYGILGVAAVIICLAWVIFELRSCSNGTEERFEIIKDDVTGKYGLRDVLYKRTTIACRFDSIDYRKNKNTNFFYLYNYTTRKIGIADSTGHITVDCVLDSTRQINSTGLLQTFNVGKKGLVNFYGEVIVPCQYEAVLAQEYSLKYIYYVGNIIPVKETKKSDWTLFNRKGKQISPYTFYSVEQTNLPDLIKIKNRKYKWGLMNVNGTYILPCEYYSISEFGNNLAWRKKTSSSDWECISSDGKKIFSLSSSYSRVYKFSEGLAAIKDKNNKIGYCDVSGKIVIPCKFYVAKYSENSFYSPSFNGDKAFVAHEGKIGTIDKKGNFTPEKR